MATFDLGRVTPLYKGDYSASTSYELNDVVLYNGNLYWHVQATATVGILPTDTTVWKLAFADEGVRAEIRGYADNAQASADSASASKSAVATSASQASASASQAALSAQTAQTAETSATASAQTATTKASEATASAQSAASSAQTATDKATLATNKAQAASESASLATAKASAAATSETNAATSAQTATAKASEAAASATSAQEYDEFAQQSAVNAQTAQGLAESARDLAQGYAEDAQGYANDAQASAESISASAATAGQAPIADGQGGWAWGDVQTEVDSALSTTSTNPVQNKVVYEALNEVNGRLGGLSSVTRNMVNLPTGRYWEDNGAIRHIPSNNNHFGPSDMIPCEGGKTYTVTYYGLTPAGYVYVVWFDSNKERISGDVKGVILTRTATAPDNAAYIYSYLYRSGEGYPDISAAKMQIEEGTESTGYIPHYTAKDGQARANIASIQTELDEYQEQQEAEKSEMYVESKNLFKGVFVNAAIEKGNFVPKTTGKGQLAHEYYIPVNANQKYTASFVAPVTDRIFLYIIYYNSEKTFLSSSSAQGVANGYLTYTTPENCAFVRFYVYSPAGLPIAEFALQDFQFEAGSEPTSYVLPSVFKSGLIDAAPVYNAMVKDGLLDAVEEVPDYYFENSYLDNKVARIEELASACAGNDDAFIFITDQHWTINAQKSIALIRYISERTNICRVFNGGDVSDYGTYTHGKLATRDYCDRLRNAFDGRIYHAVGNHEYFVNNTDSNLYYLFDMYNNDQTGNGSRHYYYVDNVQQRIRYVILNSYGEMVSGQISGGYEETQQIWLRDVALDVEAGWSIIIFAHNFFATTNPDATTPGGTGKQIADIVNAYSGNGEIVGFIAGHAHYDMFHRLVSGIPVITVTCDKNTPWVDGSGTNREPFLSDRATGTTKEQAFDVVFVDKTNKTIRQVRIGCPIRDGIDSATWTEMEERVTSYARS